MILKQRPLLPSLREKKRYIVYEVLSDKNIEQKDIKNTITSTYEGFFGHLTMLNSNIRFIDTKKQKGIIKINNKFTDNLKAMFTQINNINNQKVILRSLGVSGILNKAKQKYYN